MHEKTLMITRQLLLKFTEIECIKLNQLLMLIKP